MKTNIERPTTSQMRQLVVSGMNPRPRPESDFEFMNRPRDRYINRESKKSIIDDDINNGVLSEDHRIGVRVGRIGTGLGERAWQLSHVDAKVISRLDGEVKKISRISNFEWSERLGVYVARRVIRMSGDGVKNMVYDRKDETIEDNLILNMAEQAYQSITKDECDELIEDTRAYYRELAVSKR